MKLHAKQKAAAGGVRDIVRAGMKKLSKNKEVLRGSDETTLGKNKKVLRGSDETRS
jgi:hypothetical protein